MEALPDYVVQGVICDPLHFNESVGPIAAQIVVCADKGWLTIHYDPGDGRPQGGMLILSRKCEFMPPQASIGERAVLEMLFGGPGFTRHTQALKCYENRSMAAAGWRAARNSMLQAGLLMREDGATYQKKRLVRAAITTLVAGALVLAGEFFPSAKLVTALLALATALLGVYLAFKPKAWLLTAQSAEVRQYVLARNERVLRHHNEGPVSLHDALAAGVYLFANPPLTAPGTQKPSWFSSTPDVESKVGGGFFLAAHLLTGAFSYKAGGGRDSAGSG